jgi:hypothetical protein
MRKNRVTVAEETRPLIGKPTSTAKEIAESLSNIDPAELPDGQIDQLRRVASGFLRALMKESLRRCGHKLLTDWPRRGAPGIGHSLGDPFDHRFRMKLPTGEVVLVSHPYHLCNEEIQYLAGMIEKGWDITVDGRSFYYPADTVAIQYRRRKDNGNQTITKSVPEIFDPTDDAD